MLSSCFLNSYGYLSFMSFTAGLFLTNRMMFPNYLCGPEDGERILKVTKKSGNRGRCRKESWRSLRIKNGFSFVNQELIG